MSPRPPWVLTLPHRLRYALAWDHELWRAGVFSVGCPRSGTTWVQRLLADHPQIRTGQESNLFSQYIGPQIRAWRHGLRQNGGPRGGIGLACYHRDEQFIRILKTYMGSLLAPLVDDLKQGEIFVEKTPSHALFIREIMEFLPESRFIHVLRDPRDVIASLLAASKGWGKGWAPKSVESATRLWVQFVSTVESRRAEFPDRIFELRYEDLHRDPHGHLAQLARFVGLSWAEQDIANAVARNSADNLKQNRGTPIKVAGEFSASPVDVREPAGFVRKARPETWRDDLSLIERARIWRIARNEMARTGYPWKTPL